MLLQLFLDSTGVSIDSRTIIPGQIFFAIKGENFDGHSYVNQVLELGANLAVIDNEKYHREGKTILVDSALKSLQNLATEYRRKLSIPVLAITGSNGKTTTKELIDAVLKVEYTVHTTPGNLNNHLGVPLTILGTSPESEILIVEMGANHIGEIRALCEIAEPDYGLITNIGLAHLDGFGSYNGIILGKTEMYRYLAAKRKSVFYNTKDRVLLNNLPTDLKAIPYLSENINFHKRGMRLGYKLKDSDRLFLTHLTGDYNETNILAALTIGTFFGVDIQSASKAICEYLPEMNRSQIVEIAGVTLILDAYNANPSSMRLALDSLEQIESTLDKVVILGDMKELGLQEETLHQEIITKAETIGAAHILLIGEIFYKITEEKKGITVYRNFEDFKSDFNKVKPKLKNSLILIKASRSLKLERIKDLLA